jgi:hypothetical protein
MNDAQYYKNRNRMNAPLELDLKRPFLKPSQLFGNNRLSEQLNVLNSIDGYCRPIYRVIPFDAKFQ